MSAVMQGKDFNALIEATKKFTLKGESRNLLDWIRLEFSKEFQSVKAIAVDGYKLSVENSVCHSVDEDFVIYIKPNVRKVSKGGILIELIDNKAYIHDGETIMGYIQPKGEYMNYQKSIDIVTQTPVVYKIAFNGNLLIEALQSAKVTADFRQPILLEFRSALEPIILRTGDGNIKFVLPLKLKGEANA